MKIGMHRAEALRDAEAVFARQVQVEDHQVDGVVGQVLVKLVGAAETGDIVGLPVQKTDEQITQILVILDDSYFQAGRHKCRFNRISNGKACNSLQPQLEHHRFRSGKITQLAAQHARQLASEVEPDPGRSGSDVLFAGNGGSRASGIEQAK